MMIQVTTKHFVPHAQPKFEGTHLFSFLFDARIICYLYLNRSLRIQRGLKTDFRDEHHEKIELVNTLRCVRNSLLL